MNGTLIAYALVFVAVAGVAYTLWKTAVEASSASSAKLDFENTLHEDGRQKTPLERFVSPGALFRQRVTGALVPGLLVPFVFLVAGFSNPQRPAISPILIEFEARSRFASASCASRISVFAP